MNALSEAAALLRFMRAHPANRGRPLSALGYRAGLYDSECRLIRWHEQPWRVRENILAVHEPSLDEVLRRVGGQARTA